jgi:hypothetical protein
MFDSCCWQVSIDETWSYTAYAWAQGRGPARVLAVESRPPGELQYQKVRAVRRIDLDGLAPSGTFIENPEDIPKGVGLFDFYRFHPLRLWNDEFPCRKVYESQGVDPK